MDEVLKKQLLIKPKPTEEKSEENESDSSGSEEQLTKTDDNEKK